MYLGIDLGTQGHDPRHAPFTEPQFGVDGSQQGNEDEESHTHARIIHERP